ncbi:MAG TPA: 4-alpha-glucanotransferase [Candidatus Dormibacteraeota bacterium]
MESGRAWGVESGYHDAAGSWHAAADETVSAILAAMKAGSEAPPAGGPLVVKRGDRVEVPEPELITEDGATHELSGCLPGDLPLGYHRLAGAGERPLIVCPARCHLPRSARGWGFAVQLYSLLSSGSQGIGDFVDLGQLATWSSELGARFLLLNPLHSALPGLPQEPSPYYPSSRRFMNPLYLRVEGLPLVEAGERIERDRVYPAKLAALEAAWERTGARADSELRALREALPGLTDYATFCVLSERLGRPWQRWPEEYRHPRSAAVARFGAENEGRVRFHEWLQLQLDRQLAAASGRRTHLVADVAVGVHPDGADAWAFQDQLASGISVGAPPDPFNRAGQDWGLPPFDPWRLRAAAYAPFVETLRANFRRAAGLRLDHVMGLFRLFWIPVGSGPEAGAYVRYPAGELLDVLALESVRARAYVIGEDLGTVEAEVRQRLRRHRVLSYRLLWFEPGPPSDYPAEALAALTTHDLPTLFGVWTREDPMPEVRARLLRETGLKPNAPPEAVLEAVYRLLAAAPSRLLAATLEDLAGVRRRPNRPGTQDSENWTLRLPLTLEELRSDPRPRRLAEVLNSDR